MQKTTFFFTLISILCALFSQVSSIEEELFKNDKVFYSAQENFAFHQVVRDREKYPHFDDHPYINSRMRYKMRPYLLPLDSHLKPTLDLIFNSTRVLENEDSFLRGGFMTFLHQPKSYIRVAKHPNFPGYLFKVYLDSDSSMIKEREGWERLTRRCKGAENIRRLIKEKKLVHFTVPDKWLYPPSISSLKGEEIIQPVLLIVTDMNLVTLEESVEAWKSKITPSHLDELYCILSHGFASSYLPFNIPYCRDGKFACIDTEYPKREISYKSVKKYISPDLHPYWDDLVKKGR